MEWYMKLNLLQKAGKVFTFSLKRLYNIFHRFALIFLFLKTRILKNEKREECGNIYINYDLGGLILCINFSKIILPTPLFRLGILITNNHSICIFYCSVVFI